MAKNEEKLEDEPRPEDQAIAEEYGDILSEPLSCSESEASLDLRPRPRPISYPRPIPWPIYLGVSGLYEWRWQFMPRIPRIPMPVPIQPIPTVESTPDGDMEEAYSPDETEALSPILPWYFRREELRLDVDGRYPQMTASGTMYSGLTVRVHWIASLRKAGRYKWTGNVWYKRGTTSSLPYTKVVITATPSFFSHQRKVTVVFSGGGGPSRTLTYKYKMRYFHPVEFEFDRVQGAPCVTSVQTTAHPNRPAGMTSETLTIENAYRRAGFDVGKSGASTIPLSAAGPDARWSDMEMHDAMQVYWSRFANKPQWAMWVLFASLHEWGTGLGGIMFDDIGPNHRQGTAIFGDAFIANAPPGDAAPAAWVKRMRFWTACHEMGHSFNLAHSWQKTLGVPWIPLTNEPEARSFMNYPYNVAGGQSAFFANFWYRFSDSELLFLRHAPSEFVQPGNANWFDHHAFEQAAVSAESKLQLEIRVNREKPRFEFLEPVVLELKVKNVSSEPQLFDSSILSSGQDVTVILKKQGKAARQWFPFARHCCAPSPTVLKPGDSAYHSLFVS
ncbi:MAG: hypothetical protein GY809_28085, partial [Planctomycetes bacterium]|nr:hypothetical protein [Planctomycetota bacterium]